MPSLIRLRRLALTLGLLGALLAGDLSPSLAKKEEPKSSPSQKSQKPKPPTPPLPEITVLGHVDVGRHPFGVAVHTGRGQAIVANRGSKSVSIVDLLGLARLADIPVGRDPVGVAVNPETNVAVVTLAAESSLVVVDLDSRTLLHKIRVGRKPWGVAVDPGRNVAVVANKNGHSVSVVDLGSRSVVEVLIGKRPTGVAINPLTGIAAVTNQGDGTVTLLNVRVPSAPAVAGVITLPHSRYRHRDGDDKPHGKRARPYGVAFDYADGVNRFVVADRGADAVHIVTLTGLSELAGIQTLPVPGKRPMAVAVNPGKDFALVTNDKDNVYGLTLTSPALVGQTDVLKHPRGVAIDPVTCRAAVTDFGQGRHGDHKRASHQGRFGGHGHVSVLGLGCAPRLISVQPPSALKGTTLVLTLAGSGFGLDATVNFGDATGIVPLSISAGVITVQVTTPPASGTVLVSVTTGGQTTNSLPLLVTDLPPPVLTQVTPSPAVANGQDLPLTLDGANFLPYATVVFNGTPIGAFYTTIVSSTRILVTIPGYPASALTLSGGVFPIYVENPGPVPSNSLPFTLLNPRPVISELLPNNFTQGATGDFRVLVQGSGFVARPDPVTGQLVSVTQVTFNGVPVPTVPCPTLAGVDCAPTTQAELMIPAAMVASLPPNPDPGYPVEAFNPGPGGGLSVASEPFFVYANTLPPSVTLSTILVPEGQAVHVRLWRHGAQAIGAVTIPDNPDPDVNEAGKLRLVDVTNPVSPQLLGQAVTLIDPAFGTGVGTLGGLAVNPDTRRLVASLVEENMLAVVDASDPSSLRLERKVPLGASPCDSFITPNAGLPPCALPIGVAVNPTTNRAVVANTGDWTLSVVDLAALATVGPPVDLTALGPVENPAFVAVNPQTNVAAVLDQGAPEYDPEALVPNENGFLLLVNLATGQVTNRIQVGRNPSAIAINPVTNVAVVANQDDDTVSVVNLASGLVMATLPVGQDAAGVAIDPVTNVALVSSFMDNRVTAINLGTLTMATYQLGLAGAVAPLDIDWLAHPDGVPDPTDIGVVVMSKLVSEADLTNIIIMGLPAAVLP